MKAEKVLKSIIFSIISYNNIFKNSQGIITYIPKKNKKQKKMLANVTNTQECNFSDPHTFYFSLQFLLGQLVISNLPDTMLANLQD